MRIVRPPTVLLRGRTMLIRAAEGDPKGADLAAVQIILEQGFQNEFTLVKQAPADLVLEYQVAAMEPVSTKTYQQGESRPVKVGTKPCTTILRKPGTCDVYEPRTVPIDYWEASGYLELQTTVKDSSGVLVGVFSNTKNRAGFQFKKMTAENGESKLGRQALPNDDQLRRYLNQISTREVVAAYAKTASNVPLKLSNEGPLRPGNALAQSGRWQDAIASWKAASISPKDEPERAFNLALGHEALAYAAYESSLNVDEAEPLFTEAMRLFTFAIQAKPKEKDFQKSQARFVESRDNFARAKAQYAEQQRILEQEIAKAEQKARERAEAAKREQEELKELKSTREDTPDEADFRRVLRAKFRRSPGEITPAQEQEGLKNGLETYHLANLAAKRIVYQEKEEVKRFQVNLRRYRDDFALAVDDKLLDASERARLDNLLDRLQMSHSDVRTIEQEFPFDDRSKPAAPPLSPTPARKPPVAKPAKPAKAPTPATVKPPTPVPAPTGIKK